MLVIAITISAIAAWYSVAGLAAIFAAAVIPVIIMGGALEAGKIVATVWLHNNWQRVSWAYKTYLIPAIVFLMLLTSMGIFGFLSKGHADQSIVSGDAMSRVAIYDEKIATEKDNIAQAKRALEQMNAQVDQMMGRTDSDTGAQRAVNIRRAQAKERNALQAEITKSQKVIQSLQEERAPLAAEFRKVEAEVGPIKYIAALIYGDNPDQNLLEAAVRWVIILIVIVFDPLALCLILAANKQLEWARQGRGGWVHDGEPGPMERTVFEPKERTPPATSFAYDPDPDEGPSSLSQAEQAKEPTVVEQKPDEVRSETEPEPTVEDQIQDAKEFFKELNAQVKLEQIQDDLADIQEANTAIAEIEPEEPVIDIPDSDPPIIISKEEQELLNHAVELIHELNNDVVNKDAHIANLQADYNYLEDQTNKWIAEKFEMLHNLETVEEKIQELEALRNVEQQRANNLQAQLDELVALPAPLIDLAPVADNAPELKASPNSSFGGDFPANPGKGDLFLRTDYLPTKLFKFNGERWFELDKNKTDSYAYNDQYIEYLIEKLKSGEYEADDINEAEQEQIAQYLQGRNERT
jgi:cytochrome c oxidase subunit IV